MLAAPGQHCRRRPEARTTSQGKRRQAVDGDIILNAIDIQSEYQYSFRDSVIIAPALEGGAATLLSEDLADRHKLKSIIIRNPFVAG